MFLDKTVARNQKLIEVAMSFHQQGSILPDTYVIDLDALLSNAKLILEKAKEHHIELYFMLKQLGRNPLIASELVKIGYRGVVVVDYKEAEVMMSHHIPLGNVGHLVQIPTHQLKRILSYGCEIITVYSIAKIKQINEIAKELNLCQPIMLRVCDEEDMIYSGQTAGFMRSELEQVVAVVSTLSHVQISGVTSFPCFLYEEKSNTNQPTSNLYTVLGAVDQLRQMGVVITQINTPSTTCVSTLQQMAEYGSTHGEPGHGFSGSTPAHVYQDLVEQPAVVYVSEISHNFGGLAYCYGGGYYRRSHMRHALVGKNFASAKKLALLLPSLESIDYHLGLEEECEVGDCVIMAFRFQMFVTRSDVVIVKGIASDQPEVIGRYDALGTKK